MPNLVKTQMRSVMAQSLLEMIKNYDDRYYYMFGRTQAWTNDTVPPTPADTQYENVSIRADAVYAKQLTPADVSLVVNRINWTSGVVYDYWDDRYSTQVIGVNLTSGGIGYTSAPTVTITGSGTGATAVATVNTGIGKVVSIDIVDGGSGYINSVSNPLTVTISGGGGTGATATGVLALAQGNVSKIEDSKFYVYTDEFNIYLCLDNNGGAQSTVKPFGTSSVPFQTSDGYLWKFVYTVPIALRERFLTPSWIPINTSIKQGFVSGGSISSMQIIEPGSGYTQFTKITISGDGFQAANPYSITGATITTAGVGYSTATLTFDPPVGGTLASIAWQSNRAYTVGQYVSNGQNIYQVVVAGTSNSTAPSTTSLTTNEVQGATFKFVGRSATATATVSGGAITGVTYTNQGVLNVSITNGGTGYANGPNTVTFSSGAATGVAYAQNGVIYRIDITNPGFNYSAAPTITSVAGGGSGFAGTVNMMNGYGYSSATVNCSVTGTGSITTPAVVTPVTSKSDALVYPIISSGSIVGYQIVDSGVGYTAATATVTGNGTGAIISADLFQGDVTTLQSNIELTAVDGGIHKIKVVSGGYGYSTPPTVIIEGDGSGAAATASLSNGAVVKFVVTNVGSGYRWARLRIIGDGYGASGRVILPQMGGHGKNVIRNLYARNLMLTSYLSKDKIHSLNLGCDYRQLCIVRNPTKFNSTVPITATLASACYSVTPSSTIPSGFNPDDVVTSFPLTGAVSTTISSVTNSTTLVLASVSGLKTGMGISGTGIPANTTITVGTGNTIILSNPGSGLTGGQTVKFNYYAQFRVVYKASDRVELQQMTNVAPAVGDTLYSTDGVNNFLVGTVTSPDIDKYSGDFLYISNRTPFTPLDGSSQKITVQTVLKF